MYSSLALTKLHVAVVFFFFIFYSSHLCCRFLHGRRRPAGPLTDPQRDDSLNLHRRYFTNTQRFHSIAKIFYFISSMPSNQLFNLKHKFFAITVLFKRKISRAHAQRGLSKYLLCLQQTTVK